MLRVVDEASTKTTSYSKGDFAISRLPGYEMMMLLLLLVLLLLASSS